ncbi:MAG: Minf_1886 family protein [Verrucomicrobiota bacterium]
MQKTNFEQVVETICAEDSRYDPDAYSFVREGLDQTLKNLKRNGGVGPDKHVSGPELLEGLRRFTLEEFGPMGRLVLNEWGLHKCRDFGQIVFNLVTHNVLGRSDSDSIEDFKEMYTFEEAFEMPFRPKAAKADTAKKRAYRSTASRRLGPSDSQPPVAPEQNDLES